MKPRIVPYGTLNPFAASRYGIPYYRYGMRGPVSYRKYPSANLREPSRTSGAKSTRKLHAPRSQKAAAEKQDKLTRTVA